MKPRLSVSTPKSSHGLRTKPPVYPFTAIVDQEEMKLALFLNAIDPLIGGVLIMGHRGTGKSTAVRALADLLPQLMRVRDCVYGCDPLDETSLCDDCQARLASDGSLPRERAPVPVVELPLGATEDRVCGTIDIERALKNGVKTFEAGLLARANRGFLYIDEVNLLEDHLIDLLLDAAVTGRNVVEREGISIEHPARFVLIGSGNPEEGELRPQLIDRFGLHVEVKTVTDLDQRVRIVEQREEFERAPSAFQAGSAHEQEKLRRGLVRARKHLDEVKLSSKILRSIAELCQQLKVDGHRGELTIARAARALAAFERRKEVSVADVRRVATMALRHRLRRDPLDHGSGGTRVEQQMERLFPPGAGSEKSAKARSEDNGDRPPASSTVGGTATRPRDDSEVEGGSPSASAGDEEQLTPPALDSQFSDDPFNSSPGTGGNRTTRVRSAGASRGLRRTSETTRRGRYSGAAARRTPGARIALDATVRAAIAVGCGQWAVSSKRPELPTANCQLPTALRYKRFKRKAGTLFVFAIDTSGSMALNRIAEAKGALVRLLRQSYIRRDRVALVTFRGRGAELLLQPSGSVTRARRLLDELSVGGATPLAAGIASALGIAEHAARQGTESVVILLFTDGRANVPLDLSEARHRTTQKLLIQLELERLGMALQRARVAIVVVDTQNRFTSNGGGQKLAQLLSAEYVQLERAIDRGR